MNRAVQIMGTRTKMGNVFIRRNEHINQYGTIFQRSLMYMLNELVMLMDNDYMQWKIPSKELCGVSMNVFYMSMMAMTSNIYIYTHIFKEK